MKQTKTVKLYAFPLNDLNRFYEMLRGAEPILKGTAYRNIKFKIENFFNEAVPSSNGKRCVDHLVIYGDREETDKEYQERIGITLRRYQELTKEFENNKKYQEYLELKKQFEDKQ